MNHADSLVFLSAKRTPFGAFGGSMKGLSATDLGVIAAEAAIESAGADKEDYGHVAFGNVLQTSADALYHARHVGLRAGLPQSVPAITLNRLCGSGFQGVVTGAEQILTGQAELVLSGGAESMSQAPFVLRGTRWGVPLGRTPKMEDALWESLTDTFCNVPMALTAENIAEKYGVTQDEVDAFSIASQQRWQAAQEAGHFDAEIAPVTIRSRRGDKVISSDEHPRPQSTREGLAKLPKIFKKDGVIHAGAASGICDGAGALVLSSAAYAERKGLSPIARLVSWGVTGCEPSLMGLGPVESSKQALQRAGLSLDDMDLIEINEAFAPQVIGCAKALGIDIDRVNACGGAIALGHPLAASGARITAHLIHALRRRGGGLGLGSACIGGGQGIAVIVKVD
ncbi:MAG: acetyl-CoA C-acyltransferase [Myxococcota bacterium]|nr:acetyl-CoA C-acyltransferase [Myxococcota bacterium]